MSDIIIEGKNLKDIDQSNFQSVGPYTDTPQSGSVIEPWQGRNAYIVDGENIDDTIGTAASISQEYYILQNQLETIPSGLMWNNLRFRIQQKLNQIAVLYQTNFGIALEDTTIKHRGIMVDTDGRFKLGTFTEDNRNFWELQTYDRKKGGSQFSNLKFQTTQQQIDSRDLVISEEVNFSVDTFPFSEDNKGTVPHFFYYDKKLHPREYNLTSEGQVSLRIELREQGRDNSPRNDNGYLDHFLFRDTIRPFILGFNKTIVFGSDVVDAELVGDGLYGNGDYVQVEAYPNDVSYLEKWTVSPSLEPASIENPYNFFMPRSDTEIIGHLFHNPIVNLTTRVDGNLQEKSGYVKIFAKEDVGGEALNESTNLFLTEDLETTTELLNKLSENFYDNVIDDERRNIRPRPVHDVGLSIATSDPRYEFENFVINENHSSELTIPAEQTNVTDEIIAFTNTKIIRGHFNLNLSPQYLITDRGEGEKPYVDVIANFSVLNYSWRNFNSHIEEDIANTLTPLTKLMKRLTHGVGRLNIGVLNDETVAINNDNLTVYEDPEAESIRPEYGSLPLNTSLFIGSDPGKGYTTLRSSYRYFTLVGDDVNNNYYDIKDMNRDGDLFESWYLGPDSTLDQDYLGPENPPTFADGTVLEYVPYEERNESGIGLLEQQARPFAIRPIFGAMEAAYEAQIEQPTTDSDSYKIISVKSNFDDDGQPDRTTAIQTTFAQLGTWVKTVAIQENPEDAPINFVFDHTGQEEAGVVVGERVDIDESPPEINATMLYNEYNNRILLTLNEDQRELQSVPVLEKIIVVEGAVLDYSTSTVEERESQTNYLQLPMASMLERGDLSNNHIYEIPAEAFVDLERPIVIEDQEQIVPVTKKIQLNREPGTQAEIPVGDRWAGPLPALGFNDPISDDQEEQDGFYNAAYHFVKRDSLQADVNTYWPGTIDATSRPEIAGILDLWLSRPEWIPTNQINSKPNRFLKYVEFRFRSKYLLEIFKGVFEIQFEDIILNKEGERLFTEEQIDDANNYQVSQVPYGIRRHRIRFEGQPVKHEDISPNHPFFGDDNDERINKRQIIEILGPAGDQDADGNASEGEKPIAYSELLGVTTGSAYQLSFPNSALNTNLIDHRDGGSRESRGFFMAGNPDSNYNVSEVTFPNSRTFSAPMVVTDDDITDPNVYVEQLPAGFTQTMAELFLEDLEINYQTTGEYEVFIGAPRDKNDPRTHERFTIPSIEGKPIAFTYPSSYNNPNNAITSELYSHTSGYGPGFAPPTNAYAQTIEAPPPSNPFQGSGDNLSVVYWFLGAEENLNTEYTTNNLINNQQWLQQDSSFWGYTGIWRIAEIAGSTFNPDSNFTITWEINTNSPLIDDKVGTLSPSGQWTWSQTNGTYDWVKDADQAYTDTQLLFLNLIASYFPQVTQNFTVNPMSQEEYTPFTDLSYRKQATVLYYAEAVAQLSDSMRIEDNNFQFTIPQGQLASVHLTSPQGEVYEYTPSQLFTDEDPNIANRENLLYYLFRAIIDADGQPRPLSDQLRPGRKSIRDFSGFDDPWQPGNVTSFFENDKRIPLPVIVKPIYNIIPTTWKLTIKNPGNNYNPGPLFSTNYPGIIGAEGYNDYPSGYGNLSSVTEMYNENEEIHLYFPKREEIFQEIIDNTDGVGAGFTIRIKTNSDLDWDITDSWFITDGLTGQSLGVTNPNSGQEYYEYLVTGISSNSNLTHAYNQSFGGDGQGSGGQGAVDIIVNISGPGADFAIVNGPSSGNAGETLTFSVTYANSNYITEGWSITGPPGTSAQIIGPFFGNLIDVAMGSAPGDTVFIELVTQGSSS